MVRGFLNGLELCSLVPLGSQEERQEERLSLLTTIGERFGKWFEVLLMKEDEVVGKLN